MQNVITFKHKVKYYYLNGLFDPSLSNICWFNYALALLKIFIAFFLSFLGAREDGSEGGELYNSV